MCGILCSGYQINGTDKNASVFALLSHCHNNSSRSKKNLDEKKTNPDRWMYRMNVLLHCALCCYTWLRKLLFTSISRFHHYFARMVALIHCKVQWLCFRLCQWTIRAFVLQYRNTVEKLWAGLLQSNQMSTQWILFFLERGSVLLLSLMWRGWLNLSTLKSTTSFYSSCSNYIACENVCVFQWNAYSSELTLKCRF